MNTVTNASQQPVPPPVLMADPPTADRAIALAWAAVGTLIATGHMPVPDLTTAKGADDLADAIAEVAEVIRLVT